MKVLGQPLVVGSGVTLTLRGGLQLQPLLHLLALQEAGLDCRDGCHISVMTVCDELQAHATCEEELKHMSSVAGGFRCSARVPCVPHLQGFLPVAQNDP